MSGAADRLASGVGDAAGRDPEVAVVALRMVVARLLFVRYLVEEGKVWA